MKNILVLAYAISPTKGSEYAVAWNYVTRMSKYNKLTVIYGCSGYEMGDFDEMLAYLSKHTVKNVTFIPVLPNKKAYLLNTANRNNFFKYTFYFAYREWQKQVYKTVSKLIEKEKFDLVHMVNTIGFREPGYLWKLGLPYIWGPIGGTNTTPLVLLKHCTLSNKIKFVFRNIVTKFQIKYNHRVKSAIENTDLLLAATTTDQENLQKFYNIKCIHIPENAIELNLSLNLNKFINPSRYHIIFIGRIDQGKALHILLEALSRIKNKEKIHLDIVGDGPDRHRLQLYCSKNNLSKLVTWHGYLPREQAITIFDNAHIMAITSLSEANTTIVWESMSHGVPIITLDHCGMHDTVINNKTGIKIPIITYNQVVSEISKQIDNLIENPHLFEIYANNTIENAKQYTWDYRETQILQFYELAIINHSKKRGN